GDYDLLIGAADGTTYGFVNTGTPSSPIWTRASSWDVSDVGYNATPALADLDNDGDYDLLIGAADGITYAYKNDGFNLNPTWTPYPSWNAPDIGSYATPALADLDNDGDYDLLIGAANGITYAYRNTGNINNPTWTPYPSWNAPDIGLEASPALADLDNDGDYDLLIGAANGITYGYINSKSNDLATHIFIDEIGNVGIGKENPIYKLDVYGNIRTTGCLLYNGGTLGTCVSEIEEKNIIGKFKIEGVLDKITKLQPVKYTFKSDPNNQIYIGLVAEDTEKIIPEIIEVNKDKKQIKYGELTWILLQAIQEQQKEIENLRIQNNNLQSEINALKSIFYCEIKNSTFC
ncbi:MAG: FG-GAP-like repeat-containing protein, partial [Candidatus Aenigmatarchaeota archaeon]